MDVEEAKVDEETPEDQGEKPQRPPMGGRRGSLLRRTDDRKDHLKKLFLKEKIRSKRFKSLADLSASLEDEKSTLAGEDSQYLKDLQKEVDEETDEASSTLGEVEAILKRNGVDVHSPGHGGLVERPLEVRVNNFSFTACVDASSAEIKTVYNSSFLYPINQFFKRLRHGQALFPNNESQKKILQNISLDFKPGKSYLVLGPPGAGKTTLLKAIAGLLRPAKKDTVEGSVSYNGRTLEVS